MPLKKSHLRTVSNGSSSDDGTIKSQLQDAVQERLADARAVITIPVGKPCTLGFHDDQFSKLDALINGQFFSSWKVTAGMHVRIKAVESGMSHRDSRKDRTGRRHSARHDGSSRHSQSRNTPEYVFVVQEVKAEVLSRHPNLQISIHRRVATALGFKRDCKVVASLVDEHEHAASHVEISFRDEYLTRSDMWRFVISELAGKSVYKGQKLLFMNSIKAQLKAIHQHGKKRQSAFFGMHTKPIFRSESARFVLFIQMSKEMWGFDTDGTGDVMFHKVIDGFLPELFRRWENDGVRHLVSIILFTRMEYERPLATSLEPQTEDLNDPSINYDTGNLPYKDFYRVLVSDMASGSWNEILNQLKKDFKTFLRDVSIRRMVRCDKLFSGQEGLDPEYMKPIDLIAGQPTCASKGNILEAINMASTQFASDNVDRDLVRTGLSIIVVTPGTGVFEVDYNLLNLTTDVLIDNGVGIDLVCLSRMPLHSVPLFKYKHSRTGDLVEKKAATNDNHVAGTRLASSFESVRSYLNNSQFTNAKMGDNLLKLIDSSGLGEDEPWHYGVPHWVDVSFWTASKYKAKGFESAAAKFDMPSQRPFTPRVRMYEVQMMGIMENEMSNIAIPYMSKPKAEVGIVGARDWAKLHDKASMASLSSSLTKSGALTPNRFSPSNLAQSSSLSPGKQTNMKAFGSMIQWMEDYDDAVFRHPLQNTPSAKARREEAKAKARKLSLSQSKTSMTSSPASIAPITDGQKPDRTRSRTDSESTRLSIATTMTSPSLPPAKKMSGKLPRQISFGFKGFGTAAPKATPVTEVISENAHFDSLSLRAKRPSSPQRIKSSHLITPSAISDINSQNLKEETYEKTDHSSGLENEQASRPIAIKAISRDTSNPRTPLLKEDDDHEKVLMLQGKLPLDSEEIKPEESIVSVSPDKAMSPWLTVLNPWNPSATDYHWRLGRWQHVFPKPLHATHMKWRSLCSPASVPLTTEGFPTPTQLAQEYEKSQYVVRAIENDTNDNEVLGNWLIRELVGARFSHGFQVILSDKLAEEFELPLVENFSIFNDKHTTKIGAKIFMLRGTSMHELVAVEKHLVSVTMYTRRQTTNATSALNPPLIYKPAIRTILSNDYVSREVAILTSKGSTDWERLDNFIANREARQPDSYPPELDYWQTRYVLIPVEQSSNTALKKRASPLNEDNEEEIRLEGIRKLTQVWQKNKYNSPKEKRFQSVKKKEHANPLDIIYQTRNPSVIVAAEMNEALLLNNDNDSSQPAQLLPDKDLFEWSNFSLRSLANTIQGDRGVRMMDRRWHLRLHYNCFIGMELTTWLLNNFRDVESREEALELGNELMKAGLFVHVEKRHNFRDGNFFYQIASEYRLPRSDTIRNSWFGRSIPSTPMSENLKIPRDIRSPTSADESDEVEDSGAMHYKKRKLSVALSKKLIYDVDHRRRSYRPELVALHYDRISCADDCYHLRIDWLNVTPKLIEDAISNWAELAERNGLRLVEVPINESHRIGEFNPFRAPYPIALARQPPDSQPNSYFDATSLSPTRSNTRHPYQKALLRKFGFVLDLEAEKDFPGSVDVNYSWGKLKYRYPQYISREGILLAQITDEGDFLLLANRLYNNRTAVAREAHRAHNLVDVAEGHQHSPVRVPSTAARLFSPKNSPAHSPLIKATADVGAAVEKKEDVVTPEQVKNELEAFCMDGAKLEKFYDQVLRDSKGATPVQVTPSMEGLGIGTPRTEARRGLEAPPSNFCLK